MSGLFLGSEPLAEAQLGIEAAPTRSVYHPGAGVADVNDPFSVTMNPASLGWLRGYILGLRDTETTSDTVWSGRGTGIYAATSLPAICLLRGLCVLDWLNRVQIGGALEILRPPDRTGVAVFGKTTLSLSVAALPWLSLGLSYGHLFAPSTPQYDNLNTLNLGARLRLGRFFAAGIVVYDVTGPGGSAGVSPLERVYDVEALAKLSGDGRVELAAGLRLGELYADLEPHARLWVRPRPGLGLGAEATVLLRDPSSGRDLDWRVGVGLQLDLAQVGGRAFGAFGSSPGEAAGAPAGSLAVRVSQSAYPSLAKEPPYIVRIEPGLLGRTDSLRLLERLRALETEAKFLGVLVMLDEGEPDDWVEADELREQLLRLRQAGKRVYAYARRLHSCGYYLATAAEKIFLHPQGEIVGLGLSHAAVNYKDLLDRIGVQSDYVHIGEYKLGPNSLGRSEPPPEYHEQINALLDVQFQRFAAAVASGRRLPSDRAKEIIDRGDLTPEEAKASGLIDSLSGRTELEETVRSSFGKGVRVVSAPPPPARRAAVRPVIAVFTVTNQFVNQSAAKLLREQLTAASREPQVKAIVLRIDSPGGALDLSQELDAVLLEVKKRRPLLCSLGTTAASAGYKAAVRCDRIFANPMTEAGSIGIFQRHIDAGELLKKLGIRQTVWTRGKNADSGHLLSLFVPFMPQLAIAPFTPEERARIQEDLNREYIVFLDAVAQGRKMTREAADRLGRGRVWPGTLAVQKGLCDELGGFLETVAEARRRAGMKETEEVELRFPPSPSSAPLSFLAAELRSELWRILRGLIPFVSLAVKADAAVDDKRTEMLLDQLEILFLSGRLMMPETILIH